MTPFDVFFTVLPAIAAPVLYIAFFYVLDEICHSAWAYRRAAEPVRPRRARSTRPTPIRLVTPALPAASRAAVLTPGR